MGAGSSEDICNSQQSRIKKKKNQKHIFAALLPPDFSTAVVPVWLQISGSFRMGHGGGAEGGAGVGGGGACQEGWLALRGIGRSGRNKESLRRSAFLSLSP